MSWQSSIRYRADNGHLKSNALPHWQPVELSQYWRNMLAPANASNEARGSILDTLNQAVGNREQQ